MSWMLFHSSNQHCHSVVGNWKHWPKRVKSPTGLILSSPITGNFFPVYWLFDASVQYWECFKFSDDVFWLSLKHSWLGLQHCSWITSADSLSPRSRDGNVVFVTAEPIGPLTGLPFLGWIRRSARGWWIILCMLCFCYGSVTVCWWMVTKLPVVAPVILQCQLNTRFPQVCLHQLMMSCCFSFIYVVPFLVTSTSVLIA